MSFPLLASLGVRLDKENLYTNLLAAVKEKNLGRDVITNQFVSEISDAMGKRAQGHSVQSSGLMTAKQACHILALMVDQVKFPSEDSITKQIRTQLWHKRDLDKLKGMLKEGLVIVYYSFLDVHGVKTVYLCICVFSCETLANIDSDILVTLAFQKYSTCHAYLHFSPKLYLCICVFLYLCILM